MLLLTALVLALSAAPTSSDRVAIYVFAQPSATGFTDVNQQQRAQSVADLTRELSKKKTLTVVDDPDRADLQIEVLENTLKATGNIQLRGVWSTAKAERITAVHVALRVANYALEIEGRDKRPKRAAAAVADHVVKWVKDNRAALTPAAQSPARSPPR